jgi:dolichol kinase
LAVNVMGPLMREGEERGPSAQLFYILGLVWAIFALPKIIAVQAILTLAWMDPLAAVVGVRYGRRSWSSIFHRFFIDSKLVPLSLGAKTVEGSFAGFCGALLAGLVAWSLPALGLGGYAEAMPSAAVILGFSALGAVVAVIAEAWPSQWDDNISIPFWTGLLLWALSIIAGLPLQY